MIPEEFYNHRARECQREADAALLSNQRDTFLRSQAAWLSLAARQKAIRLGREQREVAAAAG